MNCPRCNASLTAHDEASVEIDACSTCGGVWLDAEELGQILAHMESSRGGKASGKEWGEGEGGKMLCPRCRNQQLDAFEYLGDSGIELDRCHACNGLWLDGGEREKIEAVVVRNRELTKDDASYQYRDRLTSSPLWKFLEQVGFGYTLNRRRH